MPLGECLMKCCWKQRIAQGKSPDYHDFVGIVILLIINSTISFIEENNAGNAAAALMARLAPKAKVFQSYFYLFYEFSIMPKASTLRSSEFWLSSYFYQVLRDRKWSEEDASVLVPGDIISIKLGDIIPADARLLEGDPLKIDQVNIHSQFWFHGKNWVVIPLFMTWCWYCFGIVEDENWGDFLLQSPFCSGT